MFPAFTLRYARLPERFYERFDPVPVKAPELVAFNRTLAEELGFDLEAFDADQAAAWFAGNQVPPGAEPLAMAYAGHQFGNFVPRLGDGRAVLLGEVTDRQGRLRDIQLKGAGCTPFSRGGDGRAPLGPVLREYLVSEAMHAMGIPTTRALAAVTTGERVVRRVPEPGGVVTRVASSHIRVGTFQYFATRGDIDGVRTLADHVIERHFPELLERPEEERYLGLLEAVQARQAALVARWMGVGFIHGVMNTDNTAISGETIDFGPCAFMEAYDPRKVFSSIDAGGRYAYGNQPGIIQWNLARFAETLLPLIDAEQERAIERATKVIEAYPARYESEWLAVMRAKLGLEHEEEGDAELAGSLLEALHAGRADFTLSFRQLADVAESSAGRQALFELCERTEPLETWLPLW
ncbi:YdiU family protein, partial [Halomonas sp. BBD48]|nr:YdiU family protein [Halomonas sp. BBD48]